MMRAIPSPNKSAGLPWAQDAGETHVLAVRLASDQHLHAAPEMERALKEREQQAMATAHDTVCGMDVDEQTAAGKSEYQGETYYFCSLGCKRQFEKNPERYVGQQPVQQ